MSAAVNSQAAVSFGSPQDVEVFVNSSWVPGAMLGWRHDDAGVCEAWVRLRTDVPEVVEGAGTWVGLADVRLPERHLAPAPEVPPAAVAASDRAAGPALERSRRARRHGLDMTAEMPAVGGGAGRHRARAVHGAGRHRAVTAEMPAIALGSVAAPPAADTLAEDARLYTRPIRLGDLVPHPRGGRPAVRPTV
ncbi:hypothetical protein ACI796_18495 [Geodermatophilus sp. SYSU D00525]